MASRRSAIPDFRNVFRLLLFVPAKAYALLHRCRLLIWLLKQNHRTYLLEAMGCAYASTRSGTSFDFDANRAGRTAAGPPRLDEGFPAAQDCRLRPGDNKVGIKNPPELQALLSM